MNWTPELEQHVANLWMDGKSATEIGDSMGLGRGSIMSKVSRLGLKRPGDPRKSAKPFRKSLPETKGVKMPAPYAREGGVPFSDLKPKQCQFSITEHDAIKHLFCGAPSTGGPYCDAHKEVCYTPKKEFKI